MIKYLSEKNINKSAYKNKKNKKLTRRNKSYDSIMPANNLDEIYNKKIKNLKLLN